MTRWIESAVLMLALLVPTQGDPPTVFKAGTVITGKGDTITDAVIIVEQGKIVQVGTGLSIPANSRVIDLGKAVVMPGLVDANLVFWVDGPINEEAQEVTPDFRIAEGLNPKAKDFQRAVQMGVTTAFVGPGNRNVIGGLAVVTKTSGDSIKEMTVREDAALKACVGSLPTFNNYPPRGSPALSVYARRPTTRMGVTWEFTKAFEDAKAYDLDKPAKKIPGFDVLVKAMQKRIPVRVASSRAMDLDSAIRMGDEFGLSLVIEEAEEAYRHLDLIAKKKIPIVLRPTFKANVVTSSDQSEIRYGTFQALLAAGVPTALLAGGPNDSEGLLAMAVFAMRFGATREQALRAITLTPAEIIGVSDRVGSIEAGKDADFAVYSGDPLASTTRLERVYILGRQVAGQKDY